MTHPTIPTFNTLVRTEGFCQAMRTRLSCWAAGAVERHWDDAEQELPADATDDDLAAEAYRRIDADAEIADLDARMYAFAALCGDGPADAGDIPF